MTTDPYTSGDLGHDDGALLVTRRDPVAFVLALARTAAQVVSAIALVVIAADIA